MAPGDTGSVYYWYRILDPKIDYDIINSVRVYDTGISVVYPQFKLRGPSWSVGTTKRRESEKPSNTNRKSMILGSWGPLGGALGALLGRLGGLLGRLGAILGVLERS